jgi:hypothetical protein
MTSVIAASFAANVCFAVFLVIFAFGVVFGFFTVNGSGINNHPWDARDAPGARLPDEFHQFAERQLRNSDLRGGRRAAALNRHAVPAEPIAVTPATAPQPPAPLPAMAAASEDMTIDEVNRRLADEAAARRRTPGVRRPRGDETPAGPVRNP